jgi:hypothetical protein
MANNKIQIKRTSVTGRTPNTTNSGNSQYIDTGELALNIADGVLYTSNGALITIGANLINQNITGGANAIALTNATSNWIYWTGAGTAAPTFTTRSAGTKVVLYPTLGASQVDYAFGINAGTLWSSIPGYDAGQYFKWYGGETEVASLSGTGNLLLNGSVNAAAYTVGSSWVANTLGVYMTMPLSANGGVGTGGQVLTSNGSTGSPYWSTVSGGGGGSITVRSTNGNGGTVNTTVTSVTGINFDESTGIHVTDQGSGNVFVSLGSSFKTIQVSGQNSLIAVGEDTLTIANGVGITLTTSNTAPKTLTIASSGGSSTKFFTFNQPGYVTSPFTGVSRFYPASNTTVTQISASVSTVSANSMTFRIIKNGTSVNTYTISASNNLLTPVTESFTANTSDYITVDMVSGVAFDLRIQMKYS